MKGCQLSFVSGQLSLVNRPGDSLLRYEQLTTDN
jgi:hypothetical protein